MKLALSNIAWRADEEEGVRALLVEAGIDGVELAPTMIWPEPLGISEAEARTYRAKWEDRGISVVALQALLFGRPELTLFDGEERRLAMLEHLNAMARLGSFLGVGALVFGSPRNRCRGDLEPEQAMEIAECFFRAAGEGADDRGTCLCLEPNPPQYGCDFVTDSASALELVRRVDHPGFGIQLDTAAMSLVGDAPAATVHACRSSIRHFHASEAFLAPLGEALKSQRVVDHTACATALRAARYQGFVSVEMRRREDRDTLLEIRRVAALLREHYGGSES